MPVVYIDVVWLVNFAMDAVMLCATGWIAKRKLRVSKVLLSALVGSLYSLALFFPSIAIFTSWPFKAIVSLLMVRLALPIRSWLDLARMTGLFYVVAVIFAGSAIMVHFAIPGVSIAKGTVISGNRLVYLTSVESLALVVAIPLSIALIKYLLNRVKHIRMEKSTCIDVQVTLHDRSVSFVGLFDTGNHLRDPISRQPVCLVDGSIMAQLLPPEFLPFCTGDEDLFGVFGLRVVEKGTFKFSIIPFRGAGGRNEMTVAIRPDIVQLKVDGTWIRSTETCLMAIHPKPLSTDGRFQAILHTDVITGDDRLESDNHAPRFEYEASNSPATSVDTGTS